MLSGKITEPNDWNEAFRAILDAAVLEQTVLTVISDTLAGSIGIKHGRYLTGAVATSGATGVAALRHIMALQQGFYNYLTAENVVDMAQIDQGLNIDLAVLLGIELPQTQQSAADEATAQFRRTFQKLRPVAAQSAELDQTGSFADELDQTGSFADELDQEGGFAPEQYQPTGQTYQSQPSADNGYDYLSSDVPMSSGSGRTRTNAFDRIIYGATSTYMKLVSLKAREAKGSLPHVVPDQVPFGVELPPHQDGSQPAPQRNLQSSRGDNGERLQGNRKLRTTQTDFKKPGRGRQERNKVWPPDGPVVAMMCVGVLGIAVVIGGSLIGFDATFNRSHAAVGKKYLGAGNNELAVAQFTMALEQNPADVESLQLRAQTYEAMKDFERAGTDYDQLADLKPKALPLVRKAAFYRFKAMKYEPAIALCEQILIREPDDDSARSLLAMSLARSGRYSDALKLAKKLDVEVVPSYLVPDFFDALAYAHVRLGEQRQAIDCYSRAIAAAPRDDSLLFERGAAFAALKDYKHAIADYSEAVRLDPGQSDGALILAKAYEADNNWQAAAVEYEKLAKLKPSPQLYMRLADCHMNLAKFGYVVNDCDSALSLQPTNSKAAQLKNLALEKAKSEKPIVIAQISDERTEVKPRAVPKKVDPTHDSSTASGYNMLVNGDAAGAIGLLGPAVNRSPLDTGARRFLATALANVGRYTEAFGQYGILQQQHAMLPSDEIAYAKTAVASGHSDRAIEIYLEVLARDPKFIDARVNLVKCLIKQGYKDKAVKTVAQGIAVNPNNKQVLEQALQP